ncbi:hypothetical protein EDB80DRAFT_349858 [Ilyonectria destructans]|nr:hypothetical protein EDB80DRAFT_349858 [Ilyonectria destructans]
MADAHNAKRQSSEPSVPHSTKPPNSSPPAPHSTQAFSRSFLQYSDQALSGNPPLPASNRPSYADIIANRSQDRTFLAGAAVRRRRTTTRQHQNGSKPPSPWQGKTSGVSPAWKLSLRPGTWRTNYVIRTHVATKLGTDLHRIPQASRVRTGWAIRAADLTTRGLLVQRQAEWATDIGPTAVEISKKWFTYVVPECPRRLTDTLYTPRSRVTIPQ